MDKLEKTFQTGEVLKAIDLNAIKDKVNELVEGSNNGAITIDSSLDSNSTNPVQNKVITGELNKKSNNTQTEEPGLYLIDTNHNIVVKYNTDGFDVAKLSAHFKSLLPTRKYPDFSHLNIFFVGDSITASSSKTDKFYWQYLVDWCKIKKTFNGGVSGDKLTGSMASRILNAGSDVDVVVVFGGTNDWQFNSVLGTPDSASNDGTVCGAVKYIIECHWQRNGADKPILFFSPIPRAISYGNLSMNNTAGYSLYDLKEAIKNVCYNYGVPFLDQYDECLLKPWTEVGNSTYFSTASEPSGDGLHPNAEGHKIIAWRMMRFLGDYLIDFNI